MTAPIPKLEIHDLRPGARYRASVTVDGEQVGWLIHGNTEDDGSGSDWFVASGLDAVDVSHAKRNPWEAAAKLAEPDNVAYAARIRDEADR